MREVQIPADVPSDGFDAFMHEFTKDPEPWYLRLGGHYKTTGAPEWGPIGQNPWRLGDGCTLDLDGGVLELDYQAIPDDYLVSVPLHLVCSAEDYARGKTGEEAWASVPKNECVKNGTMVGNHSKLVDRYKAAGAHLQISGAILQGHSAAIENIHLEDFGSLGQEAFPLIILGAMGGFDRHALSTVDPSHMFDEDLSMPRTHIAGCTFGKYQSPSSDNQVTVFLISGAMCNTELATDHWEEIGDWKQIHRVKPYITDCHGAVTDRDANNNQCQLATIYQAHEGEIYNCSSDAFQSGVYGDFDSTFDLDVHHNRFTNGLRGVAQLLSPTAGESKTLAPLFSSSGLKIRSNYLSMIPTEVWWHGCVTLMKLPNAPPSQYIRDVLVDDNDMVMVGKKGSGNLAVRAERIDGLKITPTNRPVGFGPNPYSMVECTRVEVPPSPSKKGCNPFNR